MTGSFFFWLVVAVGADGVFAEDFSGCGVADGGVVVVDQDEDGFADVGASDAEVADVAGVTDADFPVFVDFVGSGSPFVGVVCGRWGGFGEGRVGGFWCA